MGPRENSMHGVSPWPQQVLDVNEMSAPIEYYKYMARGGFPMTCTLAGAMESIQYHIRAGIYWWISFCKRNAHFSLCDTDKLDSGRARNTNTVVLQYT